MCAWLAANAPAMMCPADDSGGKKGVEWRNSSAAAGDITADGRVADAQRGPVARPIDEYAQQPGAHAGRQRRQLVAGNPCRILVEPLQEQPDSHGNRRIGIAPVSYTHLTLLTKRIV